ncbi:MAG: hypothetical protein ACTSWN_09965 [Promethearchaeota archaeon]
MIPPFFQLIKNLLNTMILPLNACIHGVTSRWRTPLTINVADDDGWTH